MPEFFTGEACGHLTFLFRPYRPQFYFWEVVESARRLILGAVLVVIFRGDPLSQVACGCLVATGVVAYQARYQPYRERTDNTLAFCANSVVFFVFFVGMLLYADADQGRYDGSPRTWFGVTLILLNLFVVGLGTSYIAFDRFGITARSAAGYGADKALRTVFKQAREAQDARRADHGRRHSASTVEMVDVAAPRKPRAPAAAPLDAKSRWKRAFTNATHHRDERARAWSGTARRARLAARTRARDGDDAATPGGDDLEGGNYGEFASDEAVRGVNPMRRDRPAEDTYAHYAASDANVAGVNPMQTNKKRTKQGRDGGGDASEGGDYGNFASDDTFTGVNPMRRRGGG